MRKWIDNTADRTSIRQDEIEMRPMPLPIIKKLLETENLRILTDNAICDLEAELHELIIEVRNSPEEAPTTSITSKKSLLQNLRNASIKLNLARDQIESRGKTSRYYQYLLTCKEYLEKAYEQYVKITIESKNDQGQIYSIASDLSSGELLTPVTFLIRGKTYLRELGDTQHYLQQMYDLFCTADELWPDQCNQAISKLRTISQRILNTVGLLNSSPELPPDISALCHELIVKLYHLDEQARNLVSLIASFRPLCQTKSKQLTTMKKEILCKLETFEQSYSSILQSTTQFFKKANTLEKLHTKPHGLMLVKTLQ